MVGRGVSWSKPLGAIGILFGEASTSQIDRFISDTLGALLKHDETRQSSLVETLSAYLEQGGHLAHTAEAAHIHVNTLYARLQRLDAILGKEWRLPDNRLQVQLALRLMQLRSD